MSATGAPMRVAIVPHTHWDREWYAPFQAYRLRLVRLLDTFLPFLERDPSYRHFLLDGQTAVVDDYVEIRPDAEARIRRLVSSGRLSVGPWAVLMDEFMVSAETIVRNLRAGLARAAELGGTMEVGYLPDMFGHVAQMPQILAQAGLDHAVVWRGVPAAIETTGFWWVAPDGSRVRAEYLYGSYSNGRDIPREPDRLVERARNYEAELGPIRLDGMLLMNGTDHQVPQTWLGEVVAAANATQGDYEFAVTSLREHLLRQPVEDLPEWRGELRSGARANVLMGVASNRVDVHRAAAAAERALERRAEPLAALVLADEYPHRLLDVAWHNLVLNSAHDSSCACSHDEVVEQVVVRYREARQIAEGVAGDAVKRLAAGVRSAPGATVVVNPTNRLRRGLVEVPVPGEGPLHFVDDEGRAVAAQVVEVVAGERFATQVVGSKLGWVLDLLRGAEFAGVPVAGHEVVERDDPGVFDVTVRDAGPGDEPVDVGDLRERLQQIAARGDDAVVHIRALRAPSRRTLLEAVDVPGFGWRSYEARPGSLDSPPGAVSVDGATLRNDRVEIRVDAGSGTFSLHRVDGPGELSADGLHRLVDGGDGGDTYNWSPPDDDVIVDHPDRVEVTVAERGPLRGRIDVVSHYSWPAAAVGDERSCQSRSDERVSGVVRTSIELRAGEVVARIRTEIDNPARDHRLRAHFPLPRRVDGSDAECAFAVVHRGLEAEGGPNEVPVPTFPSRRFVDASDGEAGLALIHDGLLEYEVVGGGRELALTLLRCVGYLSRIEPQTRPNPAGPPVPVEGAQMQGRNVAEYAVLLHHGDWQEADLYGVADHVLVPLERAPAGGPAAGGAAQGRLLAVDGAEVSACHRDAGGLVVRVFNPLDRDATASIELGSRPAAGWLVDLRDRPVEPFDGAVVLPPGRFVTLRLTGT